MLAHFPEINVFLHFIPTHV